MEFIEGCIASLGLHLCTSKANSDSQQ